MTPPKPAARLTTGERVFLQLASDLGGTAKVFPDQNRIASKLENLGLVTGNNKIFDRTATITTAGRAALKRGQE